MVMYTHNISEIVLTTLVNGGHTHVNGNRVELCIGFITFADPAMSQDCVQRLNGQQCHLSPTFIKATGHIHAFLKGVSLMECLMVNILEPSL